MCVQQSAHFQYVFTCACVCEFVEQLAVASLFSYDVFKRYISPNASGTTIIFVSRAAICGWWGNVCIYTYMSSVSVPSSPLFHSLRLTPALCIFFLCPSQF